MSIKRCARAHFDKHVIKMILEYTQLLCTAWHVIDKQQAQHFLIYRPTHINHPCAVWVRQHINNYQYVLKLALKLCDEWRYRYQHLKTHACEAKLQFLANNIPNLPSFNIDQTKRNPKSLLLPLPQAMPEECKRQNSIKAYRCYYRSDHKKHLRSWKRRGAPYWW